MLDTDDIISGICVLTNETTGDVYRVAVMIAPCGDTITWTAQSIDRSQHRSVTWRRDEPHLLRQMIRMVGEVATKRPA